MKNLNTASRSHFSGVEYVMMDIDDTLTLDDRLPAVAYAALEKLKAAGYAVIPVTGRPAGWCDMIACFWPVDAVVGENGAFYFQWNHGEKKMLRRFHRSAGELSQDRKKLDAIAREIMEEVPGSRVADDQAYRATDLAIDFRCGDPPLDRRDIEKIVAIFQSHGATAKISSIHVNGWFGDYDKLEMAKIMFRELFRQDTEDIREKVLYAGDSPNDSPMFGFFPHSAGVANIMDFDGRMENEPGWIVDKRGGFGFAQIADFLVS